MFDSQTRHMPPHDARHAEQAAAAAKLNNDKFNNDNQLVARKPAIISSVVTTHAQDLMGIRSPQLLLELAIICGSPN